MLEFFLPVIWEALSGQFGPVGEYAGETEFRQRLQLAPVRVQLPTHLDAFGEVSLRGVQVLRAGQKGRLSSRQTVQGHPRHPLLSARRA